ATILVSLERVAYRREEVSGIHCTVADEPERVTVYGVRSGFGDHINCSTRMAPVICRKRARFDFEFLKSIRERKRETDVRAGINVSRSIEEIVRCIILPAGNRERGDRWIFQLSREYTAGIWNSGPQAGDPLRHISSVEGEFGNTLLIDDLADNITAGLHHVCSRLHLEH